jgi:hypothetical protein
MVRCRGLTELHRQRSAQGDDATHDRADMGNQTMKPIPGHTNVDEVARYRREANQTSMADSAVAALSRLRNV